MVIADKFSNCNDCTQAENLNGEFCKLRNGYCGLPVPCDLDFYTELVSKVLTKLKHGKAADIFGLSAEHLIFSHPAQSICGHSKAISSYPSKWLRASRIQSKLHT